MPNLRQKDTATLYPRERNKNFQKELIFLIDSLRDFLKTVDEASKCLQKSFLKPKAQIGSIKSKDNLSAHY